MGYLKLEQEDAQVAKELGNITTKLVEDDYVIMHKLPIATPQLSAIKPSSLVGINGMTSLPLQLIIHHLFKQPCSRVLSNCRVAKLQCWWTFIIYTLNITQMEWKNPHSNCTMCNVEQNIYHLYAVLYGGQFAGGYIQGESLRVLKGCKPW